MIQIPFDELVEKIKEASGLSEDQILVKIDTKLKQLSGLISKDGAAHIVANELGVKLLDNASGKIDIKNIFPGMRNVETVGKVSNVYPVRSFESNGRKGKVGSFTINDPSGAIRVVVWGDQAEKVNNIQINDIIKVKSAYVRQNNDTKELHMNDRSVMSINPPDHGLEMPDFKDSYQPQQQQQKESKRKDIKDLSKDDGNVEILGHIVQVFEPRFYEVCAECGKRLKQVEGDFSCDTHGKTSPEYAYFMGMTVDDGTENIRAVAFRNQVDQLLGLSKEKVMGFKDNPDSFSRVRDDALGNIVKLRGRVSENQFFNRTEFVVQSVDSNPDPEEEIKRLNSEVEKIE